MEAVRTPFSSAKQMLFVLALTVAGLAGGPERALAQANPAHAGITEYLGPATCVACHQTQAQQMFGAVHYQFTGPTPDATNIPGNAGKSERAFNTYCGATLSSRKFACWGCHATWGKTPQPTMTADQLNNIDCLMCHQDQYQRKAAPPFESVTFTDFQGTARTWSLPVENQNGDFNAMANEAKMTVSIVEAARTVHRPTRASCLRCHANAAASDGAKRGDISSADTNPTLTHDRHMSPQGSDMTCQTCHQTSEHRIMGRGLDLRESDRPERLTCMTCHPARPHGDAQRDNHAARIACQTCHIPTYAKDVSTETQRDWRTPVWSTTLLGGQGGYKPDEIRGSSLTPSYAWYDGTSQVYVLGQVPLQNAAGQYELAFPNGTIRSAGAKIHPMKEHTSVSALHDATGQIISHSAFKFFVTGDFNQAVADGMQWAGLTGSWSLVGVHTFQTINHGVEPATNALACGQCHKQYAGTATPRMDLQGKLGYELKAPQATVCTQCHESEGSRTFQWIHDKHVTSRRYDCAWCHKFSRPERGLRAAARPAASAADFDADGDVDMNDFGTFQSCFSGPNRPPTSWSCRGADLDRDGDADVSDFSFFQTCFNGPNLPAKCL